MIFVCLGTQDMPFQRLLSMISACMDANLIEDEVVVQQGYTKYKDSRMTLFPFCGSEEMDQYINQASLIITHAGTGSIVSALKKGKPVIAVNRLQKYGEHTDDHQKEIVEEFVRLGYVLSCYEEENLMDKIRQARTFVVPKFESNTEAMLSFLRAYIDGVVKKEGHL